MTTPRFLESFEAEGGSPAVLFRRNLYEWESRQDFRRTIHVVAGAHYAYDQRLGQPSLKEVAEEVVRYLGVEDAPESLDDAIDAVRAAVSRIGRGRLWTVGADGSRRWAWARPARMPELLLTYENRRHMPVILSFLRLSDWFAEDAVLVTQHVVSSPHEFQVTNTGNEPVLDMVIRFRADGAGGFNEPLLENLTNGYSVGSTRVAGGAEDEIRIDTGRGRFEYSTDNGATYEGDYANRVLPNAQVSFMRLEPGTNQLRLTSSGSPAVVCELAFYPAFA